MTSVLIVEDERKLRQFVGEILKLEGVESAAVADGCAAVEYLNKGAAGEYPLPRVILLDMNMPCMNGFEVYQQIAAEQWISAITVVITSALGEEFEATAGPKQTLVLHKPYDVKKLIETLRSADTGLFAG